MLSPIPPSFWFASKEGMYTFIQAINYCHLALQLSSLMLPLLCSYDICVVPGATPAPLPDGPVTENPLGECRCDGEYWISEGCSYGFKCDSNMEIGGEYKFCEVISSRHWLISTASLVMQ